MSECGLRTCEPEKRCRRPECIQCKMYDQHPAYRKRKCGKAAEAPTIAALLAAAKATQVPGATTPAAGPTFLGKVKSVTKAAGRFLVAGLPIAPEAERAIRKRACEGDPYTPACEFFQKDNTCAKCGCNLTIKQAMATEKCPIGKW